MQGYRNTLCILFFFYSGHSEQKAALQGEIKMQGAALLCMFFFACLSKHSLSIYPEKNDRVTQGVELSKALTVVCAYGPAHSAAASPPESSAGEGFQSLW